MAQFVEGLLHKPEDLAWILTLYAQHPQANKQMHTYNLSAGEAETGV